MKNEQGEPEEVAVYSGDHGGIVIYPWSERFSLANHVEGLAYEMFPVNKAPEMASAIYRVCSKSAQKQASVCLKRGLKAWRFFTTVSLKR